MSLQQKGIPIREFRLADETKISFPELVVVTTADELEDQTKLVAGMRAALGKGSSRAKNQPASAVDALTRAVPGADGSLIARELAALNDAGAFASPRFEIRQLARWALFAQAHGLPAPKSALELGRMFSIPKCISSDGSGALRPGSKALNCGAGAGKR